MKTLDNKIAILMATYNGGNFLIEQIDSLFAQTYKEWELYIRDDGSSDNTMDILKDFESKHDNIHIIKDNLGGLGSRDQFLHLMDIVDADYYMFCDQDDVWFKNKIELTFSKLKEVEKVHSGKGILIGSDSSMCGPNLEIVNRSCWDHLRIDPHKFLNYQGICVYPFVHGASMIFNKKLKEVIPALPKGLPKNRPMYDWWILINAYKYGVVDLIKEPTRFYRQHANNVSGGIDKLNTSYFSKLGKLKKVINSNQTRGEVLKLIGYGSMVKYYFYKMVYLFKMFNYKHKIYAAE